MDKRKLFELVFETRFITRKTRLKNANREAKLKKKSVTKFKMLRHKKNTTHCRGISLDTHTPSLSCKRSILLQ